MKSLKFFLLVLGLVIILIGFAYNCKSPFTPDPDPPDPDPSDPSTIEVTVEYTNSGPVTATTPIWEITLISTDVKQELQDIFDESYIHKAEGKFLIIEFTAKNVSTTWRSIGSHQFSARQDNNVYAYHRATTWCFSNGFSFTTLWPNKELPPSKLVFDVPNTNNLDFVFDSQGSTIPRIKKIGISFLCLRQISHNFPQFPPIDVLK